MLFCFSVNEYIFFSNDGFVETLNKQAYEILFYKVT